MLRACEQLEPCDPTDEADVFEQGDRLCSWRDSCTGKETGVGSGTTDVISLCKRMQKYGKICIEELTMNKTVDSHGSTSTLYTSLHKHRES